MTDRLLSALRSLGIERTPVTTLEREGAFFALLPDLLVYQDEQGTRRVTLRDLTRIHSDAQGLLRVETPAGTALTASLLGFDPAQVQPFFAQVRDATAQAKNLPAAPLPGPGGFKTFGSMPRTAPGAPGPSTPPHVKEVRREAPAAPVPAPQEPVQGGHVPPASVPTTPGGVTVIGPPEPAPITSPPAGAARPVPAPTASFPASPAFARPSAAQPAPVRATPAPSRPVERPVTGEAGGAMAALARRAGAVNGLVSRLQVLTVVLGLAAIGLAVFQFLNNERLNGMWTLIAGGVSCIALLAFADVTRLIVALARAVAEQGDAPSSSGNQDA